MFSCCHVRWFMWGTWVWIRLTVHVSKLYSVWRFWKGRNGGNDSIALMKNTRVKSVHKLTAEQLCVHVDLWFVFLFVFSSTLLVQWKRCNLAIARYLPSASRSPQGPSHFSENSPHLAGTRRLPAVVQSEGSRDTQTCTLSHTYGWAHPQFYTNLNSHSVQTGTPCSLRYEPQNPRYIHLRH